MQELTIDREFEDLCPPLTAEESKLLEQSIVEDGCRDAIIVWANHDDTILDGHNRYRFCTKHERAFKTKALKFDTRQEAVAWIARNQLGRRNLNESQRAMLAAHMIASGGFANLQIATTVAAETCNVSSRTVSSARKVVEDGSVDLQRAVQNGEVAVSAAAVVAELPKAEQRKIVKQGPAAVKEAAKEIKAEKAHVKKYNDEFDPAKLEKQSAADKKKQGKVAGFNDKRLDDVVRVIVKAIDKQYDGLVAVAEERWETTGKDQQGYERAKRAVEQNRRKSHDAINGVLTAFNLWRGK